MQFRTALCYRLHTNFRFLMSAWNLALTLRKCCPSAAITEPPIHRADETNDEER
jgi:hypothetical protein